MTVAVLDHADRDVAPATRATRTGLIARLSTTAEEIEALRPRWRALEGVVLGATLFQSEAWNRGVASARGLEGAAILTLSEGTELIALMPLRIIPGPAGRVATGFGEPFQQYSEMLLAPGYDGPTALRMMLATLRAEAQPD